jgi:hypothetical protein
LEAAKLQRTPQQLRHAQKNFRSWKRPFARNGAFLHLPLHGYETLLRRWTWLLLAVPAPSVAYNVPETLPEWRVTAMGVTTMVVS